MEELLLKFLKDGDCYDADIIEYIYLLVSKYNLEDYVKDVVLDGDKHLGSYNPNTKEISINTNRLLDSSYKTVLLYQDMYRLNMDRLYIISILNVIYHEIYHAIQTQAADSCCNDTLHKVIKEGIELGRRSPNKLDFNEKILFDLYYSKVLIERNAEIQAVTELLKLQHTTLLKIPEISYLRDYLNTLLNRGYFFGSNPCKTYYKLRNKKKDYSELDFDDADYNMLTRLSWGFPVDKKVAKNLDKAGYILK